MNISSLGPWDLDLWFDLLTVDTQRGGMWHDPPLLFFLLDNFL